MPALLSVASCTGNAPAIQSVRYYTIATYNPQTGERSEALSLFASISHEDGAQALEEWSVSNESAELYWRRSADSLERKSWDDRTWIGASYLRAPDGEPLPRGRFSFQVVDRGGREAQTEFEVRTLDFSLSDAGFPELLPVEPEEGESSRWQIEHSGDRVIAVLVDQSDEVLGEHELTGTELTLEDFNLSEDDESEAAGLFIQELRRRSEVWLISGPWDL